MGISKIVISAALLAVVSSMGCDSDLKRVSFEDIPPTWDLVGTWVNPSDNDVYPDSFYTFLEDGTFLYQGSSSAFKGSWSLHGVVLSMSTTELLTDYEGTFKWTTNIAVVGDSLYFETLNREDTGDERLDGTWRGISGECEEGFGDASYIDAELESLRIEVSQDLFFAEEKETYRVEEDGEHESGSDTSILEGIVYQQNGFVGLGDPNLMPAGGLPDDLNIYDSYYYFQYFGYRVSDDVILLGALSADQAAQKAFTKTK